MKKPSVVQFGPQFEAGLRGPVAHLFTKLICVVSFHQRSESHRHIYVFGAEVLKSMGHKHCFVHPRDSLVLVLECHRHDGEPLLGAGVKHARAVFEKVGAEVAGALRKNHQPHAVGQTFVHRGPGEASALFALAVDPNCSKEARAPADDGPIFGLYAGHVYHGEFD